MMFFGSVSLGSPLAGRRDGETDRYLLRHASHTPPLDWASTVHAYHN